ncbi:MAG: lytic murein transglycosylase, partial [Pseudomonadota bacterium]
MRTRVMRRIARRAAVGAGAALGAALAPMAAADLAASDRAPWAGAEIWAGRAMAQSRTLEFERWLAAFSQRARRAGLKQQTLDRALSDVRYTPRVVERDRNQPEFVKPVWEYLDGVVSETRVTDGRAAFAANQRRLSAIEARYNVPAEVLTAFWGVESNFGGIRGDFPVIQSLATLAFEGRRRAFWEQQLIAALQILESGDATLATLKGSWAGAMGHTQFIPTSYQSLAVDFDGDGKRDIWSDDPSDALASTANYMVRSGWRPGEPWGLQVALPPNFDYALAGATPRPTSEWAGKGVTLATGEPLPAYPGASLFLPAGARGPAFLTLANYRAIRRYNPSDSYALAVALLSERVAGRPPRTLEWPRGERMLGAAARRELQEKLTALGYDTGGVDGVLGPNTQRAVRNFQRENSLIPDGFAGETLLSQVRRAHAARRGGRL